MAIESGIRLAHYEISLLLGRGGMGEVWRATDTRLGRDVAIKVLPTEFTRDAERLSRLEREARVLASLDHPNIASIHGIEEADEKKFLVMQIAEGEDLSERLKRGALPVGEAIAIARQIAAALDAAHEKGVVHRDLKPANIKIDDAGKIRVLDFGLAKAMDPDPGDPEISNSPTMVKTLTSAGVILGTAAYMSPEQARGHAVDKRADIWAFGVILWEMLTGRRLFAGETVSDILASVLARDIDLEALPADVPSRVRKVVSLALVRDPRLRLRDIGDAALILGQPEVAAAETAVARPLPRFGIAFALLGTALLAGLGGAWLARRDSGSSDPQKRLFRLAKPVESAAPRRAPTISPDGQKMTWIQDEQISLVDLAAGETRVVADSFGGDHVEWSSDGTQFAFSGQGKLWRHDLASGHSTPIASIEPLGDAGGIGWSDDGRIVFCTGDSELFVVSSGGGVPASFLAVDPETELDFHEVSALPDARGFLFVTHRIDGPETVEVISDEGRKVVFTVDGGTVGNPVYAPEGYLVYERSGSIEGLWAMPFSLEALEVTGPPRLVDPSGGVPRVSAEGTLVFESSVGSEFRLVSLAHDGSYEVLSREPFAHLHPLDLSTDGGELLARISGRQGWDFWLVGLDGDSSRRLTFSNAAGEARWIPGSEALLFDDGKTIGRLDLLEGSTSAGLFPGRLGDVGPDGNTVVYVQIHPETRDDVWVGALDGSSPPRALLATPARENDPTVSPDGRWFAYASDESGRYEIYVKPLSGGDLKWQVSTGGGADPQWDPDGTRLYWVESEYWIYQAEIGAGERFSVGQPVRLVAARAERIELEHGYVPIPGARRFIAAKVGGDLRGEGEISVMLNWSRGLPE